MRSKELLSSGWRAACQGSSDGSTAELRRGSLLKHRPRRWAATKFAAVAGCVGVVVHVSRSLGLGSTPASAPLTIAIPAELFIDISIGVVIDLLRPIQSRWRAMLIGMLAMLPAFVLGVFLFGSGMPLFDAAYTVAFGSVFVGGSAGLVLWDPEDADPNPS